MTPTPTPTAEQSAIVDAYLTGSSLVIEAGAGTGKTSTLRMLAAAAPRQRALYVAYNRAIADDARGSFPANVDCATAHSLAYRAVGRQYRHRLNGPRMPARETARVLGVRDPLRVDDARILAPTQVARLAMETVNRFCRDDASALEERHVPVVAGLDDKEALDALRVALLPIARRAWQDIVDPAGRLKFTHDHYLKMWQLSGPRLPYDVVYLDEAQDANPVIAAVVQGQAHTQRVLVGDRCQAIYGWRGAVDAMQAFDGDRLALSQSFRFGPAVAAEANKWLDLLDSPLRLRGFERINSAVESTPAPDGILCRTNAEAVARILAARDAGQRPALVGGGTDIRRLAEAAVTLKAGAGCHHPELFAFANWAEVQDYVEQDSAGADLKVFVKLIDNYGPDVVMDTVDRLVPERSADVVISTAHKAKGREWDTIRIAGDFREPQPAEDGTPRPVPRPEAMLAYVAVTRARLTLDRAGLAWIDQRIARDDVSELQPAGSPA